MGYIFFHFEWFQYFRQSTDTWSNIQRHDLWCLELAYLDASYSPIAVPEGKEWYDTAGA